MDRRLYRKRFFRALRRQFDIFASDDEDELEPILGDGTDKQSAEMTGTLKPPRRGI